MVFPPRLGAFVMANALDGFGNHCNRAAGAFRHAQSAALAVVIVEGEALARTELDHRIVGAHAIAVVAFEAIAAGETTARLEERIGFMEASHDLVERGGATR